MSMDESLRQGRDRIRGEAERRFAQQSPRERSGPPCPELVQWLQASPEHARAYAATRADWARLGRLRDDPDMQALQAQVQARLGMASADRPGPKREAPADTAMATGWRAWSIAAGAVLAVAAGMLGWRLLQPAPPPPAAFATVIGEQRNVTLEDGSAVTLNTGTLLEALMGPDSRQLWLQHGEALFDVRSDKTRPFVVQAGHGSVTALGTRFQVRRHDALSIVTLLEGSVEVRDGRGHAVVLKPEEQARFDDSGGAISVRRVDPEAATGWTRGWLIFHRETLGHAVEEVNLYSHRRLRLDDPALAQLPISGNFRIGDSGDIAQALAALLPIEVEDTGTDLVLKQRDRSR